MAQSNLSALPSEETEEEVKFRTVKQLIKILEKMPQDALVGKLGDWKLVDWTYEQLTHADLKESVERHESVRQRGLKVVNDWVVLE